MSCTVHITRYGDGLCVYIHVMYVWPHVRTIVRVSTCSTLVYMCTTYVVHVCEGRDEAMASGGVILETKKQPETLLLKYSYSPPENNSSRRHGFIPTFTYVCYSKYVMYHVPCVAHIHEASHSHT